MSKILLVDLNKIIVDQAAQDQIMGRQSIDKNTILSYAEVYRHDPTGVMPPLALFEAGDRPGFYYPGDGYLRTLAMLSVTDDDANQLLFRIEAVIHPGGKREAILFAIKANATHGLRLTNGDKRFNLDKLLNDPEWKQWTNVAIAKHACVSESFVRKVLLENAELNKKDQAVLQAKKQENAVKYLVKTGVSEDKAKVLVMTASQALPNSPKVEQKKYIDPRTGETKWQTKKSTPEKKIIIVDRVILFRVLNEAAERVNLVAEADMNTFISEIKAQLSQVAKGNDPTKDDELSELLEDSMTAAQAEFLNQDSVESN